jgi:hypothetical protein
MYCPGSDDKKTDWKWKEAPAICEISRLLSGFHEFELHVAQLASSSRIMHQNFST